MSFERSASGQANRALFYGVDWVIYTEGGSESGGPVRSYDTLFWGAVFRSVEPALRIKAIPRGGKRQLASLARQIIDDDIDNVVVAMDRDYDGINQNLLDHPRVVYTFGYSFENDIFEPESLSELFSSLAPNTLEEDELDTEIGEWSRLFISTARWPMKVDIIAKKNDVAGFDRDRPQKYFQSNAYGCEPKASRDRMVAETDRILARCRDRSFGTGSIPETLPKSIVGHLWEVFAFRLFSFLHAKYCSTAKLNYDQIRSSGIAHLQIRIMRAADNDNMSDYYRGAVMAALS
ncbi:DUF4435 domain-containing protein [Erythrobacter aureus]|uniref:DUF4435 domain-containing protein n=1 Tax=Erythrobacter aureus TaxID=2182384 RepID=UPI003A93CB31